ncbi:cupin domain-containing protein [Nocardia sp. R6R-6]|uniref:cupin domain-containing protein n=1 Tax=Nocardia sp. R6R-6 TaxID=3459303 RepID=UPI00403D775B
MANSEPSTDRRLVVRAEERDSRWFFGDLTEIIATGEQTEGRFTLFHTHTKPNGQPPLHEHDDEDECFFILEGSVTFWAADFTATLHPGDFILLPRHVPHTFQVSPDQEARWITILAPAGFEKFVIEMSVPAERRTLAPKDLSSFPNLEERMQTAAAKRHITLLGPPGTLPGA